MCWWMTLTYFSRSQDRFCIYGQVGACERDNLKTKNIWFFKLILWMHLIKVLEWCADGWPWPISQGHRGHDHPQKRLVGATTCVVIHTGNPYWHQICIWTRPWTSSKMGQVDLLSRSQGSWSFPELICGCNNLSCNSYRKAILTPNIPSWTIRTRPQTSLKMGQFDLFSRSHRSWLSYEMVCWRPTVF